MGKVYSKGKVHSVSVMGGVQRLRRQRSRSPRDSPGSPSSQSFSSNSITSTDSEISFDEDDGFKTLVEQKKAQFAKAGYMFPICEKEIDRLQTLHYMFRYFWGNNFSSPMEGVLAKGNAKILDIGCGPGIWILECATTYQSCSFTGIDIAALYPSEIKPRNTEFLNVNIFDGLPFEDNTFDFVHQRFMMFAYTIDNWQEKVLPELLRVLKPGGYLELMENDIVWYEEGPLSRKFREQVLQAMRDLQNIELVLSSHIPEWLSRFPCLSQHHHDSRKAPFGSWAGGVGKFHLTSNKWGAVHMYDAVDGVGLNKEEYLDTIEKVMEECEGRKGYLMSHRYWVRKKIE